MRTILLVCALLAVIFSTDMKPASSADAPRRGLTQATPDAVGLLASRLKYIDDAVRAANNATASESLFTLKSPFPRLRRSPMDHRLRL